MAIRVYKPTSSARRFMSVLTFEEITKKTPEKSLIEYKKKNAGRNKQGKITVRHQGGGNKVKYRIIDFKRDKKDVPAKVAAIEYDPNRSAFIALLHYVDGEKRYILAPLDLKVGDTVMAGETADIKPGNAHTRTFCAAAFGDDQADEAARILNLYCKYSGRTTAEMMDARTYDLPSGEFRKFPMNAMATIGTVGNTDHSNVRIGKAGRTRHMGIRPTVRGVVMNPCDHPHGGGEGKSPVGMPAPVTPWGKPALGLKTRKHKKYSNNLIVKRASK